MISEDGNVYWEKVNKEGGTQHGHRGFNLTGTFIGSCIECASQLSDNGTEERNIY